MAIADRGFASMSPEGQRKIASQGGKVAHQKGVAHEWTRTEARDAGRKGGIAAQRNRRARSAVAEVSAIDAEETARFP